MTQMVSRASSPGLCVTWDAVPEQSWLLKIRRILAFWETYWMTRHVTRSITSLRILRYNKALVNKQYVTYPSLPSPDMLVTV